MSETTLSGPRLVREPDGECTLLQGRLLTLGSAPECGLRLPGRKAPPVAGNILFKAGSWQVQDLSPERSLRVNGEPVRSLRALAEGDRLEIAATTYVFRTGPDSAAAAAPSSGGKAASPLAALIECVTGLVAEKGPDVFPGLVSSVSRLLRCDAARVVEEDPSQGERRTLARFPTGAALDRFSRRAIDWAKASPGAILLQGSDWEEGESINSLRKNAIGTILCVCLREGVASTTGAPSMTGAASTPGVGMSPGAAPAPIGYLYLDRLGGSDPFTEEDRVFAESLGRLFGALLSQRRALARQQEAIAQLQEAQAGPAPGIIHASTAMAEVLELARKMARTGGNVLVRGETGTGKEMLARFLHTQSPRASRPFLAMNCGAIPENLIESELFGHEKGSFTGADQRKIGLFEAADGGTVFLDEIGDLPLSLQVKLLRILQEGEITRIGNPNPVKVDVRVVSATHRDLSAEVAAGRFRQDLFFRLSVLDILLPPLRARGQDVLLLSEFLLRKYLQQFGLPAKTLSQGARAKLLEYAFPGNVRELENVIQKAILLSDSPAIRAEDLQWATRDSDSRKAEGRKGGGALPTLKDARARAEKEAIAAALERGGGNVSLAAKLLDVDRKWLMKLMEESGLSADAYRKA
jgi:DNA-binding NtrC family response regulator